MKSSSIKRRELIKLNSLIHTSRPFWNVNFFQFLFILSKRIFLLPLRPHMCLLCTVQEEGNEWMSRDLGDNWFMLLLLLLLLFVLLFFYSFLCAKEEFTCCFFFCSLSCSQCLIISCVGDSHSPSIENSLILFISKILQFIIASETKWLDSSPIWDARYQQNNDFFFFGS
jgi:hypothetical protein